VGTVEDQEEETTVEQEESHFSEAEEIVAEVNRLERTKKEKYDNSFVTYHEPHFNILRNVVNPKRSDSPSLITPANTETNQHQYPKVSILTRRERERVRHKKRLTEKITRTKKRKQHQRIRR